MKTIYRIGAVVLAAVLLLSGCGEERSGSKGKDKDDTPKASINYENYTTQAVDRKLADCIETRQVAEVLGCAEADLEVIVPKDSMVDYFVIKDKENPPENPLHLQLLMENKTRSEFDAITSDGTMHPQENIGEVAFWSNDWSQLMAYKNGYAVSVYLSKNDTMAMMDVMDMILNNLP